MAGKREQIIQNALLFSNAPVFHHSLCSLLPFLPALLQFCFLMLAVGLGLSCGVMDSTIFYYQAQIVPRVTINYFCFQCS